MNRFQKSTFTVLYIIKKSKLLKNGEAPIAMRITINGQIAEIMIKRGITVSLWDQAKERSKGTSHSARELNHYLETVRARVYQIQRELEVDGKVVTMKSVRDKFYGRDESSLKLCDIYREHNEKCRALIGVDFAPSTVDKFNTSLARLAEYIEHKFHKTDVLLSDVNGQFVRDFDFFLKTQSGCKQNSAIKHLKNLKKIIRIALSNGWMKSDPFMDIQFKHEETNVEFMTQEELEAIMNKEFTISRLSQVRDVFIFCCFTGLAFVDVKQLSREHLSRDNNGAMWIRKSRQKTKNMCNVPLLSVPMQLIEKYVDHPECIKKGVLLPVMSNQKMNSYLKEIADLCGITKKLTTHVARHTCATVVMLANNVSLENVAKILGHSNTKMTQHYAKVLDSSIMRDMADVEKCFAKTASLPSQIR